MIITITEQLQRQVEIEITDEEFAILDGKQGIDKMTYMQGAIVERAVPALRDTAVESVGFTASRQGGEEMYTIDAI